MTKPRPKYHARRFPQAVVKVLNCHNGDVMGARIMRRPLWATTRNAAIWMAVRSGHSPAIVARAFRLNPSQVWAALGQMDEARLDKAAWRQVISRANLILGALEAQRASA